MNKTIAIIKGDGIGPEIVTEAMGVLDAVAAKFGHTFTYQDAPMAATPSTPSAFPCRTPAWRPAWPPTACCWAPWAAPSGTASPPPTARSEAF